MNELYKSNLNWYKFFLSNKKISANINELLEYIKGNYSFPFDDDKKISAFLDSNIELKICFLQYTLNFVSDFFPSDKKDYKEYIYTTFKQNFNEDTNSNNNGLNKELIKQFYKPISSPDKFFTMLTGLEIEKDSYKDNTIPEFNSFIILDYNELKKQKEKTEEEAEDEDPEQDQATCMSGITYMIKVVDLYLQNDLFINIIKKVITDHENTISEYERNYSPDNNNKVLAKINAEKIEFLNNIHNRCIERIYKHILSLLVKPIYYISNNLPMLKESLRFKSISIFNKLIKNSCKTILNCLNILEVSKIVEISDKFKKILSSVNKILPEIITQLEDESIKYKLKINITKFKDFVSTMSEISNKKKIKKNEYDKSRWTNFKGMYMKKFKNMDTDNMSIIYLENSSTMIIRYHIEILVYLIEKSFYNKTFSASVLGFKEKQKKTTDEDKVREIIIEEVAKLNSFGYFVILANFLRKYSNGLQPKILECFKKANEKNKEEDPEIIINDENKDKKKIENYCIDIGDYKDYWKKLNDEIVARLFLRLCLIEIDGAKRFMEDNNRLQQNQIKTITAYISYSCENFYKNIQNVLFYKDYKVKDINSTDDDIEPTASICDVWIMILSTIIELVEVHKICTPNLTLLAKTLSSGILSMYQGTDVRNIDNNYNPKQDPTVNKVLHILLDQVKTHVYSDNIYTTPLIVTYSNIFQLLKMIISIESEFGNYIEKLFFKVNDTLNILDDFITIFVYNNEKECKKEEKSNTKIKKKWDEVNLDKLKVNNYEKNKLDIEKINKINNLYDEFMKPSEQEFTEHLHDNKKFSFCKEVFLYLNLLRVKKNVNAVKFVNLDLYKEDDDSGANLGKNAKKMCLQFFSKILKMVEFKGKNEANENDEDDEEDDDDDVEEVKEKTGIIEKCDAETVFKNLKTAKEEYVLKRLFFISNPNMAVLSKKEIEDFLLNVDRASETTKLNGLLTYFDYFKHKIDFKNKFVLKNPRLKWTLDINYEYVEFISFIFILIVNILQLIFLTSEVSESNEREPKLYIIRLLTAVNTLYNFIFLFIYSITEQRFIYLIAKRQKEKELLTLGNATHLTDPWEKLRIKLKSFFIDIKKYAFFIHIFFGVISLINIKYSIIIALQLITFGRFVSAAQTVFKVFVERIKELVLMVFFLVIITYMFAYFGFFFLNSQMMMTLSSGEPSNGCDELLECFISYFNIGVRSDGGMGDNLESNPYSDLSMYFSRYFHDFVFFVIINLLLLNMINGIIITPFGEQRDIQEEIDEDIDNNCFICSLDRQFLQQKEIGFDEHQKEYHNVTTYLEYMIYLNKKREKDLDADEIYIKDKIKNKEIDCFQILCCLDKKDGELIEKDESDE